MFALQINTTSDWMIALSKAMNDRDLNLIEELDHLSNGWLQSDNEREAQAALINAAIELIDEAGY
jgi:hypothetical protein